MKELIEQFKPKYYVIYDLWTRPGAPRVVAAFPDDEAGGVARYLEGLTGWQRPSYYVIDSDGREIDMIGHRDDHYSHASALLLGAKMWDTKEVMEQRGWKFTDAGRVEPE